MRYFLLIFSVVISLILSTVNLFDSLMGKEALGILSLFSSGSMYIIVIAIDIMLIIVGFVMFFKGIKRVGCIYIIFNVLCLLLLFISCKELTI